VAASDGINHRIVAAFGKNLRRARHSHGLTQEGLAEVSGIDRSVIGIIERGEREIGISLALRLSAALGVSLDALFAGAPVTRPRRGPRR
jgi:transcriptional regulator with XRE-family HTH domain